eukprot:12762787-Ditylum_brightwellii.AAC.1
MRSEGMNISPSIDATVSNAIIEETKSEQQAIDHNIGEPDEYPCNQVKKQDKDLRIIDHNLLHHHLVNLVIHKKNLEGKYQEKDFQQDTAERQEASEAYLVG